MHAPATGHKRWAQNEVSRQIAEKLVEGDFVVVAGDDEAHMEAEPWFVAEVLADPLGGQNGTVRLDAGAFAGAYSSLSGKFPAKTNVVRMRKYARVAGSLYVYRWTDLVGWYDTRRLRLKLKATAYQERVLRRSSRHVPDPRSRRWDLKPKAAALVDEMFEGGIHLARHWL